MTQTYTNNNFPEKPNDFELKYGNQKHNEKTEWINDRTKGFKLL